MTDPSNWMTRRQEALETGLDALKRLSACKTPVEMAVIYSEWLSGSMTRILADFEDAQKASQALFVSPQAAPVQAPPPHQLREAA
ncbi:MAG: hypothetical protein Q8N31_05845 [Reyranella sp.]|nr:hypothetical protein [Reyranella sp.]MDP3159517.1 hypothetical protein [Reyranella sp.]